MVEMSEKQPPFEGFFQERLSWRNYSRLRCAYYWTLGFLPFRLIPRPYHGDGRCYDKGSMMFCGLAIIAFFAAIFGAGVLAGVFL